MTVIWTSDTNYSFVENFMLRNHSKSLCLLWDDLAFDIIDQICTVSQYTLAFVTEYENSAEYENFADLIFVQHFKIFYKIRNNSIDFLFKII